MVQHFASDTICAIATPVGEGGIGIIKISGPEATGVASTLFRSRHGQLRFKPFRLYLGWIHEPISGEVVDEVLLSTMPGPRSYTGEDVVEINCHSGFAVLDRILGLVLAQSVRLAEPGEFSRRAFLNGRLDLSQAEAIIDVIHSRSQESLRAATRQLAGGVREWVEDLIQGIVSFEAELEATIDFSEDLEEEEPARRELAGRVESELLAPLHNLIRRSEEGRVVREGFKLVLVGKPNVGKSSLLNGLVGRDRAIVTPFPGTTRDVVEDAFSAAGITIRILDTAGLRHDPDPIEAIGMERAVRSTQDAHLILWILDGSQPLSDEDEAAHAAIESQPHWIVLNKTDLPSAIGIEAVRARFGDDSPWIGLSALEPRDLDRLKERLQNDVLRKPVEALGSGVIPNLRHKARFEGAAESLERAREGLLHGALSELVAFDVRASRLELEAILGVNVDEAVLDHIFSQFCIGK